MEFINNDNYSLLDALLRDASEWDGNKLSLSYEMLESLADGIALRDLDITQLNSEERTKILRFLREDRRAEQPEKKAPDRKTDKGARLGFGDLNGKMMVFVDKEKLTAEVSLIAPTNNGRPLTAAEMKELLNEYGIVSGIKESYLTRLAQNPVCGSRVLIAKGIEPVHGQDGKIVYHFDTEKRSAPKIDSETGIADFKELDFVQDIKQGELLCELIPPAEGSDGRNVFGEAVSCQKGKMPYIHAGKGTETSADGTQIYASCDGEIHFKDGNLSVDKVLMVDAVNASTGNIAYIGAVRVKNNVESGFSVKATGGITVGGVVEDASLTAGGDIVIYKGLKGSPHRRITAKGSVSALFIENSSLLVYGDVHSDYIMNSFVECEGKIVLKGRHGSIVGGRCTAVTIEAHVLGNPSNIMTRVVAAYPKRLEEELAAAKEQEELCRSQLEEYERERAMGRRATKEAEIALLRTQISKKAFDAKIEELQKQIHDLKAEVKLGIFAAVRVYPNVFVNVDGLIYRTSEEKRKCAFVKENESLIART